MLVAALIATLVQMRLWVLSLAPELGLRRAVGASAGQVMALVLGPAVWSGLGTIVRGLPAWDAGVVARFAVLLVATTLVGALGPAWRAARKAPATLLAEPLA